MELLVPTGGPGVALGLLPFVLIVLFMSDAFADSLLNCFPAGCGGAKVPSRLPARAARLGDPGEGRLRISFAQSKIFILEISGVLA